MPKKKNVKRDDGRIAVQVYLGKEEGKRRYKTVYGSTQKEANEKALQIKLSMRKGLDVTAERDTFEQWRDRWLKTKKVTVSASQYTVYSSVVTYLNNDIGGIQIGKIRTADLQESIDNIAECNPHTGNPSSRKLLLQMRSAASQIFQLAIENRILDYNPAQAVKIPKSAPQEHRRALTNEEQQWIVDTPHRARRAAMIMMYAGLRRGELIPLVWSDIDLEQKTIRVNKSVEMLKGQASPKPTTKTIYSQRIVDIPQKLVDFLKIEKKKVSGLLVCPSTKGQMLSATGWKRMWESYICDLNFKYGERTFHDLKKNKNNTVPKSKYNPHGVDITIPQFTAHWLRHTFATLLYLAGVDVLTAKDQLGHADIKTTLQIYTHLDKEYKRKSMNRLDAYLSPKKGKDDAGSN